MSEKKPAEAQKQALRQSQQYNPDFELWWNGPLYQANQNVINSYKVLEFSEESEHGYKRSVSKVPDDLFVRRVLIMRAVLLPRWRKRASFQTMDETIRRIMHPTKPTNGEAPEKGDWPTAIECFELYEAMVKLLDEELKVIKVKPPWDPAD